MEDAAKKHHEAGRKPCQPPNSLLIVNSFMFRFSIVLLATALCASCVSHRPIQDSSSPPIDAANPLDGTPVALAWSSSTQLMMGVDTGAVQTSLLFSPAVESIGARLRGLLHQRHRLVSLLLPRVGLLAGDDDLRQLAALVAPRILVPVRIDQRQREQRRPQQNQAQNLFSHIVKPPIRPFSHKPP